MCGHAIMYCSSKQGSLTSSASPTEQHATASPGIERCCRAWGMCLSVAGEAWPGPFSGPFAVERAQRPTTTRASRGLLCPQDGLLGNSEVPGTRAADDGPISLATG